MRVAIFEAISRALNGLRVRSLVAAGLAVKKAADRAQDRIDIEHLRTRQDDDG